RPRRGRPAWPRRGPWRPSPGPACAERVPRRRPAARPAWWSRRAGPPSTAATTGRPARRWRGRPGTPARARGTSAGRRRPWPRPAPSPGIVYNRPSRRVAPTPEVSVAPVNNPPAPPVDIELPACFYLGREYDLERHQPLDRPVMYDARDLTTHGVIVGMTGSG